MGIFEDLADDLAKDTLAAAEKLNDELLVEHVAQILEGISSTAHEAFMTSVRVRNAEKRARQFLLERVRQAKAEAIKKQARAEGQ